MVTKLLSLSALVLSAYALAKVNEMQRQKEARETLNRYLAMEGIRQEMDYFNHV